jgi:hypothetical protein
MLRPDSIWLRIAAAVILAVVLPASLHAETFMRSEDILRASAYQVPLGMQLAPSSAYAAMQSGTGSTLTKTQEDYGQEYRALRQTSEIVLMNVIMTLFGKTFMEGDGFNVSLETIENNLENGFEWDDNSFSANNFRHPYQGAQYFGAARSNHYDFWQSSMWAFFGSWLFEYTGEAHHPSYNDWIPRQHRHRLVARVARVGRILDLAFGGIQPNGHRRGVRGAPEPPRRQTRPFRRAIRSGYAHP